VNDFDPLALLEVLARHRVRYVLIGGYAANLHASPFLTEDVDITPDSAAKNLSDLSAALSELDAKVYTQSEPDGLDFSHDAVSLARSNVWNLVTKFGRLDISFIPNGTQGFDDLDAGATDVVLSGVAIRLCSLADIIRSKQAANRPKDQRVLPTLREILASRNPRNNT
jgi:hypothetical protein